MRAVTIERTSKTWKLIAVIGAGLFLIGLWGATLDAPAAAEWTDIVSSTPGTIMLVGLGVLLVGRTGAWWNHG